MGVAVRETSEGANVITHPGFTKIPLCQFTLKSEAAQARYNELVRLLWNAGRLSLDKHMTLSNYCMLFDQIQQIEKDGRVPRASWFTGLLKAQKALGIDDLDKPIAAPVEAPRNRFEKFGIARRRRSNLPANKARR